MKKNLYYIAREFFYAFSASLVIFYALELAWKGVVLSRMDVGPILLLWLSSGILVLGLQENKDDYEK